MKIFLRLTTILFLLVFTALTYAQAQSKIMDAKLNLSTGQLDIYLTDETNLQGLEIYCGSTADTFLSTTEEREITSI